MRLNDWTPRVKTKPIKLLRPYDRNARRHSSKQVQQIANSIERFGFVTPVLVDADNQIVAGHGRVAAAKKLGMMEVPTIAIEHLTPDELRAYALADNKIAENADWDLDILAIELQHLTTVADLDLGLTGFEMAEIDLVIEGSKKTPPSEEIIPTVEARAITQTGDVWLLGDHRLICGNALLADTYQSLMEDHNASMVFTDPPYNVPVDGHVCGLGRIKHREFAMGVGEMSEEEFTAFLKAACENLTRFSGDGALHYICMDWRHVYELLSASRGVYSELKNICVWNKDNAGMGSLYRSKHELVAVFKHGKAPHTNNIELGRHGRYRTNVWDYAGVNTMRKGRLEELAMHPTVKPTALVSDAIMDSTKRGQIVLDPFAGSGTTLMAADKTGRIARCIELDAHYCDVIIRRWETLTDGDAVHQAQGKTFKSLQAESEAGHE